MSDIFLHNTLSNTKELFTPITEGEMRMYNCGPTVYNFAHVGNLRSYVFADTLRRMFEWNGYAVKQVVNITDVGHLTSDSDSGEDKMQKGAEREGKSIFEIADFYTASFFVDLDRLNIDREHITFPRATQYIGEQIAMIEELEHGGHTYTTSDGVYFDTSTFREYGKLGNIDLTGLEDGARIGVNIEKRHATDFALWKFSPPGSKREMEWQSPWGVGFPGWHIECSAMSRALLGQPFDIHTGGIDHIPVHHNNEIAQSECSGEKPYVRVWMHNAFLTIPEDGTDTEVKMAKSGDNFITLEKLLERNIDPLAYRYLLLTARYSSPLTYSWDALEGAQNAWKKLKQKVLDFSESEDESEEKSDRVTGYRNTFTGYINDDLDTPKALALVWEIIKDDTLKNSDKKSLLLDFDTVLGLALGSTSTTVTPPHVLKLVHARDKARAEKRFTESDLLRIEIESFGYTVKDTPEGTKISTQ